MSFAVARQVPITPIVKGVFDFLKIFPKSTLTPAQLAAKRLTTGGNISMIKPFVGRSRFGRVTDSLQKSLTIPTAAKIAIPTGIKTGVGSIAKKFGTPAVLGSGFLFGSTALLSLTSGGQNLVSTTGQGIKDFSNFGQSVNKLLNSNPIIPIGLLILGGLIMVKVLKK